MSHQCRPLGAWAAVVFALSLAACGGDGAGTDRVAEGGPPSGGQPNPGSPAPGADAFVSRIMALIADQSETTEPQEIGSITVTEPEDTQPVPLS